MRRLVMSLMAAGWIVAGCGPVQTTQALSQADREIAAARAEKADTASPYEFESALRLRDQARQREGRADYQKALYWARRAAAFATEARVKAEENRRLQEIRAKAEDRATFSKPAGGTTPGTPDPATPPEPGKTGPVTNPGTTAPVGEGGTP